MKYDLNQKITRGAQRTLSAFSQSMFTLLAKESFEKIKVNELCELSNFPRATFYNYFQDKYDLLNYCWRVLADQINVVELTSLNHEEIPIQFFDRAYDLLSENKVTFDQIMAHNDVDGTLINSFSSYMKAVTRDYLTQYFNQTVSNLPIELVVNHFSNTILMLIEWIFLTNHPVTKEQGHQYLRALLGNL